MAFGAAGQMPPATQEAAPSPAGQTGERKLGMFAVCSFVIANMIGTGVFTSLGFQLVALSNQWVILSLWLLGGLLAFFGALIYAELGSIMPRSGGEYNFLSRIFHPSIGFVAGWISITIGFSAPVAATCMALGTYTATVFPNLPPEYTAIATLLCTTLVHSFSVNLGGKWQTVITAIKALLIMLFIIAGFTLAPAPQTLAATMDWSALSSPPYAISLVWVMFAYSGWNAATYIIGDIATPQKILVPALLISTAGVTLLYILLNAVFLYATPEHLLAGQIEIGNIAAVSLFGAQGGRIMSGVIAVLLISSVSSMVYVGPRVTQTMGEDISLLRPLARTTSKLVPLNALWMQCMLSLLLIVTASFDQIINFSGFVLNLCTLVVAIGLLVSRFRHPHLERPFRAWGYPLTPLAFIAVMAWILVYLMIEKPVESLYGAGMIALGFVVYFASPTMKKTARVLPVALLMLCAHAHATQAEPVPHASLHANELNQTARFVAGMQNPADTLFAKARATSAWQSYASESDAVWATYYKKKQPLLNWARDEVHPVSRGVTSLFYPFSGPDFLYANMLFPDAQVIYAIGLEKLGTVPRFDDETAIDAYVEGYKTSINEVLTSSYYRTQRMKTYLHNESVDGVIPVFMLFMARSGMHLSAINRVTLDADGAVVPVPAEQTAKPKNLGVEFIYYAENDPTERRLVYFSINLQDDVLARNAPVTAFLHTLRTKAAFTKSASYLMHHALFTTVREAILGNCDIVVSDDSGIPFSMYTPDVWNVQLYGSYKGCIPDFKHIFETDLAAAYNDPARSIKPLPFRIGYSYPSNMRIAVRANSYHTPLNSAL